MSLISGFENRYIDIYRVAYTEDDFGGRSSVESLVTSNVKCKIDYNSGNYPRIISGVQAKSNNTLFCDATVDLRVGDKIKNVRNIETLVVDQVDTNGTLVAAEYNTEWVSNPGSEDDHLEGMIYRLNGLEI